MQQQALGGGGSPQTENEPGTPGSPSTSTPGTITPGSVTPVTPGTAHEMDMPSHLDNLSLSVSSQVKVGSTQIIF